MSLPLRPYHRHHFSNRRARLTTAIAAALAVTAGPLALAAPAGAEAITSPASAPVVAEDSARQQNPLNPQDENLPRLVKHAETLGGGRSGYLVRNGYDAATKKHTASWVRTSDGSVTPVATYHDRDAGHRISSVSDVKVLPGGVAGRKVTFTDLSAGAPGTTSVRELPEGLRYVGAVGPTVIADGAGGVRLVTATGDRAVTGLPAGAVAVEVVGESPDAAVVRLADHRLAVVELATAAVTGLHQVHPDNRVKVVAAVSATHLAWVETSWSYFGKATLVVADRSTSAEIRRTTMPYGTSVPLVGLTGDRLIHGIRYDVNDDPKPHTAAIVSAPVTASGGGPAAGEVKILDRGFALVPADDGSVLVTGGTLDRDEGVYRVTAPSGAATAEKIATTGDTTRLTLLESNFPERADLTVAALIASWKASRTYARYRLTIEHPLTGHTETFDSGPNFTWDGTVDHTGPDPRYAPSGAYRWSMTATPKDEIGPPVTVSGAFVLDRTPAPHDWTFNGSPDLLAVDGAGRLWREDTHHRWSGGGRLFAGNERVYLGYRWDKYDLIESIGNHSVHTYFVARDKQGVLWRHDARDAGTITTRPERLGGGWGSYDRITGGDFDGDGRPDLVAVDRKGDQWLHPTPANGVGLLPRKKTGWGWGIYNRITAVGDVAGTPAADLVARDKAGVLWLHQGDGKGSFTKRVRIGGGWNQYTELVGIGDGDRDGRADLYAYAPNGRTYFYPGTGNTARPFEQRSPSSVLMKNSADYKIVF
ncbi:VCBS repeat-containing protein [Streptomyces sp. NPDC006798]|uniref:VCBS repeat-containing protein n=1 Tax=Streptomyces sp. NPDC006798 TaxID=3155462 RepID=UPI0033F56C41